MRRKARPQPIPDRRSRFVVPVAVVALVALAVLAARSGERDTQRRIRELGEESVRESDRLLGKPSAEERVERLERKVKELEGR